MPQFVYLDESGDTGFKFEDGSTRFFVVTMLITDDPVPIHSAVDDLRTSLRFHAGHEFKFQKSLPHVRHAFLQLVIRQNLLFRAMVIDKHLVTRPHMREREVFYNFLVKMILKHDGGRLHDATLILDERDKSRKGKQQTTTYLRRELNSGSGGYRRIRSVRYHESHRDNLLQVVDMAAGAVNCAFARDDRTYLDLLRPKLDDLWVWRPRETQ